MKPYPQYKDSGIEWIGDVPEGWTLIKMKYLVKEHSGNGFPQDEQGNVTGDIAFLKVSDINGNEKYIEKANNYISKDTIEKNGWNLVPVNSIVTAKIGESLRKNHRKIILKECIIDNNCIGIESKKLDWKFSFYLHSIIDFEWFVNPGAVPSLSVEKYKSLYCAIPSFSEQTTIATFLDHKTAEIDSIIAKKERLIELYEEEKVAVINHAVTKGLDPAAKMKDSGIEWLGEIPEHWVCSKLKYVVEVKDGTHDTPNYILYSDESFPLITSKDLQNGFVCFSECKYISKNDFDQINKRSNVEEKDTIMPMIGTVGGAVVVETKKKFSIKNVALFKTSNSKLMPYYLKYLIDSVIVKNQFNLQSRGGVQDFVSLTILNNIIVFDLQKIEQAAIVQHIETKCSHIDAIISKFKRQIELLKEYRTALISEAVTGKIDLRHEI